MAALRVLLVEDEAILRYLAAEALRDKGLEVIEASTGDEAAVLLVDPDRIDMIFTDVRMPGLMDGIDMARRARELHPGIPIIVTSGYADNLVERLIALSPRPIFFPKPYRLREVFNAMVTLSGRTPEVVDPLHQPTTDIPSP